MPSTPRRRAPARPFRQRQHRRRARHLLEAEFFGVAPGAYTGADRKGRDGKFKLADGGTLFLDEIGDMPLACRPSCCARCRKARSSRWAATSWCRSTCA
jgi:predicted ATPase with chaperone activity